MSISIKPLKIAGIGYCVPQTVVTNEDLTKLYETSDEWIYSRTGIKERRVVSGNETAIDLGFDAAKKAEAQGAQNIVIVSHGLTIATFIKLIDSRQPRFQGLDNGSVTHLTYSDGNFTIGKIGDMSYRELGQEILDAQ